MSKAREQYKNIPDELAQLPAWIAWRGKKVPYALNGGVWNQPENWVTLDEVIRKGCNPGFVPDGQFGITVVDLDKCVDEEGNISDFARGIVERLNSWTELSQSRRGLHIFCKATIERTRVNHDLGIELYHNSKYIATTGDRLIGSPLIVVNRQDEMDEIYRECFSNKPRVKSEHRVKAPTKAERDRSKRHYSNVCLLIEMGLSDAEVIEAMSRRWADCEKWNRKGNYKENLILAVREELGLFY